MGVDVCLGACGQLMCADTHPCVYIMQCIYTQTGTGTYSVNYCACHSGCSNEFEQK